MRARNFFVGVITVVLIAFSAARVWALWSEIQITPKSNAHLDRLFTMTVKNVGSMKQVDLTIEPKPRGKVLSPFVRAELSVLAGEEYVASIPVSEYRSNGKVIYRFLLSPRTLSRSKFEFREPNYGVYSDSRGEPQRDENGKPKVEQMLGGNAYWFYLKDFLAR
jgi:hypothetical protein